MRHLHSGAARSRPCRICVVAYPRERYRSPGFPFQPFSPGRRYLWRKGTQVTTDRPCWVPAECVHALGALPVPFRRGALTSTSTSGVAAWTDAEGALCRAVSEVKVRIISAREARRERQQYEDQPR